MSAIDVEDRIRHALADLAATTTTSFDAAERIEQRARPRSSRVRVALLAAAGLAVIVAGLVFVAVVLRGPASTDDDLRGPATATTPATTLPDGTRTCQDLGRARRGAWTLEALRFPAGRVRVEAHGDALAAVGSTTRRRTGSTPTALSGAGRSRPHRGGRDAAVGGPARITLRERHRGAHRRLGDGEGFGVRLFVTTRPRGRRPRARPSRCSPPTAHSSAPRPSNRRSRPAAGRR